MQGLLRALGLRYVHHGLTISRAFEASAVLRVSTRTCFTEPSGMSSRCSKSRSSVLRCTVHCRCTKAMSSGWMRRSASTRSSVWLMDHMQTSDSLVRPVDLFGRYLPAKRTRKAQALSFSQIGLACRSAFSARLRSRCRYWFHMTDDPSRSSRSGSGRNRNQRYSPSATAHARFDFRPVSGSKDLVPGIQQSAGRR
jgi:hypothetical protein